MEVGNAVGKQITTIEGIEQSGRLHPLQQAFIEAGAMQCGYCIPGMIMSAQGLLKKNPRPTEQEIIRAMEGNICRCGTHPRIAEAIRRIARSSGARKGGAR
jgi:aerobic-type carbon monoxide dehydrogenase small subunit (CoxS/CutS family)